MDREETEFRCAGNKTDNAYHVVTADGVGPTAVLDGVTIKNGYADGSSTPDPHNVGGGILCNGSSPTIRHCIVECNYATNGGGVSAWVGAAPTLSHCTIRYNWSAGAGGMNNWQSPSVLTDCTFQGNSGLGNNTGAVIVGQCSPTFTRCTFQENEGASRGGAVAIWGSSAAPQFTGCTFSQNQVLNAGGLGGGAVCVNISSTATFRDCTFTSNESPGYGGGVAVEGSTSHADLIQCSFIGNEAPSGGGLSVQSGQVTAVNCRFLGNQGMYGGGVFVQGGSRTGSGNLTNCVFSGNMADGKNESLGGGLCVVSDGSATVTNCTFSGNTATAGEDALGGGIHVEQSTVDVVNSIAWGNTAGGTTQTAQIHVWYFSTFSLSYSCVEGWTSGGLGGSYNTDDDPLLADPDGVDDTLGTADDDVRLTSGSSAIDAGCNAEVPDDDLDLDHDGDTDEAPPWNLGRGTRFLDDSGTTDCRYGGSCGTAPRSTWAPTNT